MTTVTDLYHEWKESCVLTEEAKENLGARDDLEIRNEIITTPCRSLLEVNYKLKLLADDIEDDQDSIHVGLLIASIRFDMRRTYAFEDQNRSILA